MLSWAGLGFGEKESYRLALSLKNLLRKVRPKNLTFWGKIYGRYRDYYVAQGTVLKNF